jgi:subtilisin family serine protease
MSHPVARLAGALAISIISLAAAAAPRNLGAGLREMVMRYEAQGPGASDFAARSAGTASRVTPRSAADAVRHDVHGHVAVSIHLDGRIALEDAASGLRALGAEIQTARNLTRFGEISAFVPIEKVSAMAATTGVRSIMLSHAKFHVGSVTSEGAAVLHTDRENMKGITGNGITVAALSNSYDTAGGPVDAHHDVASGDLPGAGNPLGNTKPVVVVLEDPTPSDDEGRAMLQIVHDLAPDAKLCFATADIDPISFASAILDLADTQHHCKADVMVDDVSYDVEPYFSDGLIADAVNTVASDGVTYYSSAGNDNQESYDSDFERISNKRARSLRSPVQWGQVPEELTAGGFHNFGSDRNPDVLQTVSTALGADYMVLQWNDPWNVGGMTARYVMLVFDSQGRWLNNPNDPQGLGGVDDTFATDAAFQEAFLPGPSPSDQSPVYYVAYARASTQRTPANHIRSLLFFGNAQYSSHTLPFSPQVYGHSAANGAVSVAADYWDDLKGTEYFSSLGPVTIYFDGDGNRLAQPVTRLKPDITAVDGVHTTFFLQFIDNSGFPSFFGTSAAAPHAAGVAALLLQAAGGPGSKAPALIKRTLIDTAHAHPKHDGRIRAFGRNNGLEVSFAGRGFLRLDPTKFSLSFGDNKERNRTLRQFDIDVAPAGLIVAGDFDVGDPGDLHLSDIKPNTTVFPSPTLSISFAPGAFRPDDRISFGFRFNEASILLLGRNVSVLAGSKFRATFSDGTVVTGTLDDELTHAWSESSGFGLIDAQAAVRSLQTEHD